MPAELSKIEQFTLDVCRNINERSALKSAQRVFLQYFASAWVGGVTGNLTEVHGLEKLRALDPEKGVLLCANHRSFFDLYVVAAIMYKAKLPWNRHHFYPVRSNFFYETWAGLGVNLLIGGGSMYPPIYRDNDRKDLTKASVGRVIELLGSRGTVVGVHPEGTRGKGDDPFELLPAKPGIGQMAHESGAMVIPVWIRGLSNSLPEQVRANFGRGDKRGETITIAFGDPVDLSEFHSQNGRVSVYKRMSDRILENIAGLAQEDRARNNLV